jgi:hypothetical protein
LGAGKAFAELTKSNAELAKQMEQNAKDQQQEQALEENKRKAEQLRKEFESLRLTMERDIKLYGLNQFEAKLLQLEWKVADMRLKFGSSPIIVQWELVQKRLIEDERIKTVQKDITELISKLPKIDLFNEQSLISKTMSGLSDPFLKFLEDRQTAHFASMQPNDGLRSWPKRQYTRWGQRT